MPRQSRNNNNNNNNNNKCSSVRKSTSELRGMWQEITNMFWGTLFNKGCFPFIPKRQLQVRSSAALELSNTKQEVLKRTRDVYLHFNACISTA
jgi:hypothetical protein